MIGDIITIVHNPLVQLYMVYFETIVGSGAEMYELPEEVKDKLKLYFPPTLLERVRYGSSHHTSTENTAMTDCTDIYFPAGNGIVKLLKNNQIFTRVPDSKSPCSYLYWGKLHWLIHELYHTLQCVEEGGRPNYATRWFGELPVATIEKLITSPRTVSMNKIHDSMFMEERAESYADEVLYERLCNCTMVDNECQ
ncbi:MAG: hypothetical protein IFK94_13015 [Acidobacteria bacterium]|uniref:Uncharacterized protein n=1 Tax=Candidatus Polarisedimenticola svalbardensis TaxID=2886004 RepID=A0A8J6XV45_9BACT|nr:hypothetical protein [Candidatus Polarisedimenticola svalbardensis]